MPPSLVGPVTMRGRTASSRVLFGPHETNLAHRREISDRHVAYYARRAAGGAGMIVTEAASVHDSDHPYERAPLAADCAPGWADVVRACRPHGALVLAGLGHAGGQGSTAYGPTVLWGPSRVADVASREVPMEMERPEIDALVAGFGAAGELAVRADLDGVEVNAGQHSLLRQFLSRLTNHRTDPYGQDPDRLLREVLAAVRTALGEDRVLGLRLCCDELAPWAGITPEQAAATVSATARWIDYLVVVRGSGMSVPATRPDLHTAPGFNRELCAWIRAGVVAGHDHRGGAEHGRSEAVAQSLRPRLDDDRRRNWPAEFAPAARSRTSGGPQVGRIGSGDDVATASSDGGAHRSDDQMRPVEVQVVLQGSVVDPCAAQAALDDGVADLVEMTRAQIAEPDLVAHVRADRPERIRPCTLSNQRTSVRDTRNPLVSDDAEPGAGHETEDQPVEGTDPHPREVLVVGGGPAGLEAARVLALRGHRVLVAERNSELGGALRLAAAVESRARWGLLIDWWQRELERLGVAVRTGVEIALPDLDAVVSRGIGPDAAGPDRAGAGWAGIDRADFGAGGVGLGDVGFAGPAPAVLLATGSRPGPRSYPSDGVVLDVAAFEAAVLRAGPTAAALDALPPGPVVVHDPIGDSTGVGVAEQVAAAGRPTVIVTPDQVAGTQLARTGDLAPANARLERAGVARELRSVLRGVQGGIAVLEHVWTGERREIACALVIDCGHRSAEDALWLARPALLRAGDCVAPRTVYEAVLEGRRAALAIGASPIVRPGRRCRREAP